MFSRSMFPIHCNKCFVRHKQEPTMVFRIARCGHIVCATCLQDTCPICSKRFDGTIISNEMPPGMSDYFGDPLKIYRRFQKITKFQYDQEKHLVIHLVNETDEAERKAKRDQLYYTKLQKRLQIKIDQERELICKYRAYIAKHERETLDAEQPIRSNTKTLARRNSSEQPAKPVLDKIEMTKYERPMNMNIPIICQTSSEYIPQINRTQPRPNNPHRKSIFDPEITPSSTLNAEQSIKATPNIMSSDHIASSEQPPKISLNQIGIPLKHASPYGRSHEQSCYMKPPIIGQTNTHSPNQTIEYIHQFNKPWNPHRKSISDPKPKPSSTFNTEQPIRVNPNLQTSARRASSEQPAKTSFGKIEIGRRHTSLCERPREQSCYMTPPIIGPTRPRYPAPNQATEYLPQFNRTLKRTHCLTPPITTDPRPRYPSRKSNSESPPKPSSSSAVHVMPQLMHTLRIDDDKTGGENVPKIGVQRKKAHSQSPILPCEKQKKFKPNAAWDSTKHI